MNTARTALRICLPALAPLLLAPAPAAADRQSYLEAVAAEVEEFTSGRFPLSADSPWVAAAGPGEGAAEAADPRESFAELIMYNMPGTYRLYQKLSPEQQGAVFEAYSETGDLDKVRGQIMEVLRRGF